MGRARGGEGEACGDLYLVSTPIGNLGDITLRALEVLGGVSLIACEDTRRTRKLLDRYGIRTPTTSYHQHNEAARCPQLLRRIRSGSDLALVTDGGTPCISDPGYLLVRKVLEVGGRVLPVPGPSAFVAAVSASGIPSERILFEGFLPPRQGPRRNRLRELAGRPETIVIYEAPHRLPRSLQDLIGILGNREAALARELTKVHEEWIRGTLKKIRDELPERIRGEVTIVIRGAGRVRRGRNTLEEGILIREIRRSGETRTAQAVRAAARRLGVSRREAYRLWIEKGKKRKTS